MMSEPRFSVVYYSDLRNPEAVRRYCLTVLRATVEKQGGEIIAVDHAPAGPPSHADLYARIMRGLIDAQGDTVFLAEDDVLYPAAHFCGLMDRAKTEIVHNTNIVHLTPRGFISNGPSNGMCCYAGPREALKAAVFGKQGELERNGRVVWTEPNGAPVALDNAPVIDVRHGRNLTGTRTGIAFPHWSGWGAAAVLLRAMKLPVDIVEDAKMPDNTLLAAPEIENPKVYIAMCCAAPGRAYARIDGKWHSLFVFTTPCGHCRKDVGAITSRIAKYCESCGKKLDESPTLQYAWGLDEAFDTHLRVLIGKQNG